MPNNETAKTKLALSTKCLVAAVLVVACVLIFGGWNRFHGSFRRLVVPNSSMSYRLESAMSKRDQQKGLGDRASMPEDQGMLFVFARPMAQCFWMKDMRFSLDMIWLNSSRKVVHIEQNVSPRSFPKTFCPQEPAKYVIELNAGQAKKATIITGQTLQF